MWTVLWVLESNGIHSQILSNKSILFSRIKMKDDCGIGEDGGEIMKRERAIILLERTEMCKELALTAREADAYFGGSAVTW